MPQHDMFLSFATFEFHNPASVCNSSNVSKCFLIFAKKNHLWISAILHLQSGTRSPLVVNKNELFSRNFL